jgi:hypothetical protein
MEQAAVQNRFETIFVAAGAPPEMLLVGTTPGPGRFTHWLRLPNERYRHAFHEFAEIDARDLPRKAILLVGYSDEFERLFEYDDG